MNGAAQLNRAEVLMNIWISLVSGHTPTLSSLLTGEPLLDVEAFNYNKQYCFLHVVAVQLSCKHTEQ